MCSSRATSASINASQIIDRLRPQLAKLQGVNLFLQPTQDINVGARIARGSFQYTLQDTNIDELNEWSQKLLDKLRTLPQLADVTSDLAANAPKLQITINRDQASRFGISPQTIDDTLNDAFGQREITQYFTQLKTYFRGPGNPARIAEGPVDARPPLRQVAADRRRGAAVVAGRRSTATASDRF